MLNLTEEMKKNKKKIKLVTMLLFTSILEACTPTHKNVESIVTRNVIDETLNIAIDSLENEKDFLKNSKTVLENLKREKQTIQEFKLDEKETVVNAIETPENSPVVEKETTAPIMKESIAETTKAEEIVETTVASTEGVTEANQDQTKPEKDHDKKPNKEPEKETSAPSKEPETETSAPNKEPETETTAPDKEICTTHVGTWHNLNDTKEERICDDCQTIETRNHTKSTKTEITSLDNGSHKITNNTTCKTCDYTNVKEETQNCELQAWSYDKDLAVDTRSCKDCGYTETKEHEHSEIPENINYTVTVGPNDTHTLEGNYNCTSCNDSVTVTKEEDCEYTYSYDLSKEKDKHTTIKDCNVCQNHIETLENCTPTGEIQSINDSGVLLDYYNCLDCNGRCQETKHITHELGAWESKGNTHISYCRCGYREEKDHDFTFVVIDPDNNIISGALCPECGHTFDVTPHAHAPHEMDLISLVTGPYYSQLESKSQIPNPTPNPDEYCSAYVVICSNCSRETKNIIKYRIEYGHKFQDGKCTRSYCGNIAQSPEAVAAYLLDQVFPLETKMEIVQEELTVSGPSVSGPSLKLIP